jgi:L-asparaginase
VNVALATTSFDDDGSSLRRLIDDGFGGLVIEALGGGHVPPGVATEVDRLAEHMPVLFASRTGRGEILRNTYQFTGSELDLRSRGAVPTGWLDGPKARLLLMLLLRAGYSREAIERYFVEHLLTA